MTSVTLVGAGTSTEARYNHAPVGKGATLLIAPVESVLACRMVDGKKPAALTILIYARVPPAARVEL
jgi:hypothetical protein